MFSEWEQMWGVGSGQITGHHDEKRADSWGIKIIQQA
jgi:hypothetical protein